jgi:hypothetical protein
MGDNENKIKVLVKAVNSQSITLEDPSRNIKFDWPLEHIETPLEIGSELYLELKNNCPSENIENNYREDASEEQKRRLLEELLN